MDTRANPPEPRHDQSGRAAPYANGESKIEKAMRAVGAATSVSLQVVFPGGRTYRNREEPPAVSFVFRNQRALRRVALSGHVGLMEAYFDGDVDVEGNFALAFRAGLDAGFDRRPNPIAAIRNAWHEFRYGNGVLSQAKANARFHYGLGQDFYRLWLDEVGMLYTCAYWKEGTKTLEEAQTNKMDHVCRKVQLKAGETFADIGSGWGGLLFHAYERFGGLGTGINTTTEQVNEQVQETRKEIKRRGLEGKVDVVECDFREVPRQFDKLLSIGTLEHAGRDQLPEVIQAHAKFLKPGGLGVIHFIGHVGVRDTEFWIRKYIFPGGWIPSLAQAIDWCERSGLEVVDIENLRRHYALTLDAWAERFERNWPHIQKLDPKKFDERFYRVWRTYLWSCAEMFRSPNGKTHLFQIVVSKGNVSAGGYPMSRRFLYDADR
jgi:cyclopropane-fatty-acyl-phospholipid synthase